MVSKQGLHRSLLTTGTLCYYHKVITLLPANIILSALYFGDRVTPFGVEDKAALSHHLVLLAGPCVPA